ncbi:MAG: hypothetical protein JOY92_10495 [Verrucomicrobia bacterium]|nr:hypothetical protein [Verrucomicrobiota bacterium]
MCSSSIRLWRDFCGLVAVEEGQPVWSAPWVLIGAGLAGYLLLLITNPVFPFFLNGLRALQRYPRIWLWFGALSGLYFLFQCIQAYELGLLQVSLDDVLYWPAFQPENGKNAAAKAWLPALDGVAGLFQQAVVTFPASALAAFLFLCNWRSARAMTLAVARKRLKRWSVPVYCGVLLCAVAALLKPLFAVCVYVLNDFIGAIQLLQLGAVLDAFSFQFEALFGTLIEVYLVLLVYAWLRGLSASSDRVFALAVKRSVYAARWTGLLLLAGLLLVHLPLLATYGWIQGRTDFTRAVVQYIDQIARPLLDVILILFCSVQLSLVFHNEALGRALGTHVAFVRAHWYRLLWFLLVAAMHFFFLEWLRNFFATGFPENSFPERFATLIALEAKAFLSAWFLASWVCFYRVCTGAGAMVKF